MGFIFLYFNVNTVKIKKNVKICKQKNIELEIGSFISKTEKQYPSWEVYYTLVNLWHFCLLLEFIAVKALTEKKKTG